MYENEGRARGCLEKLLRVILAEHAPQRVAYLAQRDLVLHALDDQRHQVIRATRSFFQARSCSSLYRTEPVGLREQPDFFIKPHDTINVGTHATARWRAILRNAFRATYGFGFVYDRNFADRDFYTRRPIPDWF